MKVVLKQREDNKDLVNVIFFNNTPLVQYLDKTSIGTESIAASTYDTVKEFFKPTSSQRSIKTEEMIAVNPGQTFTNSFSLTQNYDLKDLKGNLYLIYSHFHPTAGEGSDLSLIQSKVLHIEL